MKVSIQVLAGVAILIALGVGIANWPRSSTPDLASPGRVADDTRLPDDRSLIALPPRDLDTEPSTERLSIEPTSESDSESEALGSLCLEIASSDGGLLAGALVVVFRSGELLGLRESDARGMARFEPHDESCEVAVFAPGRFVFREPIALMQGVQRLTLPDGDTVAGWIELDGAAPREPIPLLWLSDQGAHAEFERLPASVRERVRDHPAGTGMPWTTTDEGGRFAFHAMRLRPSGRLSWSGPYWLREEHPEDDPQWLRVPAPASALRVQLVEGVELHLRVVDAAGTAVPRAKVELITLFDQDGGGAQTERGQTGDDDGRCRFLLPRKQARALRAVVALPDGAGATPHDLGVPRIRRGPWDVGDLALQPTRSLALLVQDAAGRPVEGARVMPRPSVTGRDAVHTDVQGRCRLAMSEDVEAISVLAKGYDLANVPVPRNLEELVVTIETQCMLEFVVKGYEGRPRDLHLELSADSPMLLERVQKDQPQRGSSRWSFDAEGRCRAAGLVPGTPMRARLLARGGQVLAVAEIPGLLPGEHRQVELTCEPKALALRVRVQDVQGVPITGALVIHKYPGTSASGESVDLAGEILLRRIYTQPFTVVAHAPGFAPNALHGVRIPPEQITIVLDPPRSMEVELRSADGSIFTSEAKVSASVGGPKDARGVPLGNGRWSLDGLPHGEISLWVEGEFGFFHELHDTSQPVRVLTIGEKGTVRVSVVSTGVHERVEWGVALAESGSRSPRRRERFGMNSNARGKAEFSGLPLATYDVWLETRGGTTDGAWSCVGTVMSVKLDLEHHEESLELRD